MPRWFARSAPLLCLIAPLACAPAAVTQRVPADSAMAVLDPEPLVELLRFEDTRTFDAAAFERLASSASPVIRSRTMLAAGRIGDRAGTELLLRGVTDAHDSVRTYAAFALGELGDSSARVAAALGALAGGDQQAAAEALASLGKIGGSHARPYVENALRTHKSGPALHEALLAIWRFPRQPSTSMLVRPHAASADREVRWRAVYALTRGGPDPANVSAFMQWLRDADPLVRSFAARGLRGPTADSAGQRVASAAALEHALTDSAAPVRINAVGVLATYRDSLHARAAAALLADADLNVRMAAAQALALMRGSWAGAALEARAVDATERIAIRGTALVSLAAVAPERAFGIAGQFSTAADPLLRLYAARALGAIRTPASFAALRTLARDADPRVEEQSVSSAAGLAGDTLSAARAFFIEELAAASPFVRAAALGGLQRLAGPGDEAIVMEALEFALRDSVDEAANAALAVLGKLAESNPAITRTFTTRFPISRIALPEVRRTAIRQLKLEERCCTIAPQPAVYERVVATLLMPALQGKPLPRVRITTSAGAFELELLPTDAPLTVDNFLALTRRGYFNGGRWHRVVPNFVLQDGDPTGTGSGGPGYAIRDEINRVRYVRGTLGMALSGPDTGGSQFFVTHSPQPHLDGGYTVFGRVVSGMDVAERVIQDDPILSIELIS